MMRKVLKLVQVNSSPPPSLSPLHVPGSYGLPASSRLPKFMIAAVAGFILLTTVTYYFLKWFCFRKYWNTSADTESSGGAPSDVTSTAAQDEIRERTNKALVQRLCGKIAMGIPTITYAQLAEIRAGANKSKEDVESEACAVCLSEFSKKSCSLNPASIKLLPKCSHAFHSSCIDLWLSTQATCPVCRASLLTLSLPCDDVGQGTPQGGEPGGDTNV